MEFEFDSNRRGSIAHLGGVLFRQILQDLRVLHLRCKRDPFADALGKSSADPGDNATRVDRKACTLRFPL